MRRLCLPVVGWLAACAATSPGPTPGRWAVAVLDPGASLRGLCVVDRDVVWVSGSNGTVQRSVDGGRHWRQVGPPQGARLDFRDVEAFDAERAVVCSTTAPAHVYTTVDGGSSWRLAFADDRAGAFFDALAFVDDRRGFLLGDPIDGRVQLFATTDGGQSWRAVPDTPAARAGEAHFAASGTCLLAIAPATVCIVTGGSHARLLHSDDLGAHWATADLPLAHGRESAGAFALAQWQGRPAVVVGGDYQAEGVTAGTAAWAGAGGEWVAASALGYRSGIAAIDGQTFVAVGPAGTSWSHDGGRTWQDLAAEGFHVVQTKAGAVFAAGANGRVGRLEFRQ